MPPVNSRTIFHPLDVHATFLSTKLIEHEHPVRINHSLIQANLAVDLFLTSKVSATRISFGVRVLLIASEILGTFYQSVNARGFFFHKRKYN